MNSDMQQTFAALLSEWLAIRSSRYQFIAGRPFTKKDGAKRLRVVRSTFYTWLDGEYIPSVMRSPQLARDMELPVQMVRDAIAFSEKIRTPNKPTTNGKHQ